MNKYLSSKIKIISFISILLVVFTHCYTFKDNFLLATTIITEGLNYGTFIQYFICNGLSRFAVPMFFMISGYLFYLSFKLSLSGYFYKIKSRFVSLLIPYILWSLISMGVCLIFWGIDIMPINDMKANMDTKGILQVLLNPPNFQFWFIKQLIIYTVLSPIIYLLLKYRIPRVIYLLGLFYIWFMDKPSPVNFIVVEALFFFSLGSYLAITNKKDLILKEKSKATVVATTVIWIGMLVVKTVLCGILPKDSNTTVILVLYRLCVLFGIFSVWFGFDYVMKNEDFTDKLLSFAPHTFFIFCFHEPLLDVVIQYCIVYVSEATLFGTVVFFIAPIVAITLAIIISKLLIKYVPFIHNILTGNRGSRKLNISK